MTPLDQAFHWYRSTKDQLQLLLKHFALRIAASEEIERLRDGSFFHVLEPFKEPDHDLVEQVNQVRRYRNWVAHGRRGDAPAFVDPPGAYDRLTRFLSLVGIDATNSSLV
jgi:hypothetical protein